MTRTSQEKLSDDMHELLLKHAMDDVFREDTVSITHDLSELAAGDGPTPSPAFDQKMQKLFRSSARRRKIRLRSIPQKIAAAIIVVIAVSTLSSVISYANGINLFAYIFGWEDKYINLHLTDSMEADFLAQLDDSWDTAYFPRYLPDKYRLSKVECHRTLCGVEFLSGVSYIRFDQYRNTTATSLHFDLNKAELINIPGFDKEAYYIFRDDESIVVFYNDKSSFIINANDISKTDLLRVARSIKLIIKDN